MGCADPPPLTVAEVAARRRVLIGTVLAWIHSGELRATNEGAGKKRATWRIEEADLAAFLESRRNADPRPTPRRPNRRPALPEVTRYF
jgi:excisionase family DNA binding protein